MSTFSSDEEAVRVVNETCQFLVNRRMSFWAETEKQTKHHITMKSLILAQDER